MDLDHIRSRVGERVMRTIRRGRARLGSRHEAATGSAYTAEGSLAVHGAPVIVSEGTEPAAVERFGLRPPLPLPEGRTEDDVRRVFGSFSIDGTPPGALDGYVADSFGRFLYTFGLVSGRSGRALELGSNPYFATYLLHRYTDLELELANYFGDAIPGTHLTQMVSCDEDGTPYSVSFTSALFNLENEPFPYDDESLAVVLFCEIIEHLLVDPTHALREINRILEPGGVIVLTTPNIARLENVLKIAQGEGIGDPYSGNGPYGRHNREYSMGELHALLRFCGFEVERSFTADSHAVNHEAHPAYGSMAALLAGRPGDLGQYLFIRARKERAPTEGLPSFLFAAYPQERIVPTTL